MKNFIKSAVYTAGIVLFIVGIFIVVLWAVITVSHTLPIKKADYYIILEEDSIKLLDKRNNVIYKDTLDWKNKDNSKIEQSIVEDNL